MELNQFLKPRTAGNEIGIRTGNMNRTLFKNYIQHCLAQANFGLLLIFPFATVAAAQTTTSTVPNPITLGVEFPPELVHWKPRPENPVFSAAGTGSWDARIRERGWILRNGEAWHLWYTGYDGDRESIKRLGHATSTDGIRWKRDPNGPLSGVHWVEDMMVVKGDDRYYMFAEGDHNQFSIMLTSMDGIDWKWQGRLEVLRAADKRPVEGPVGTPTVLRQRGRWFLFYEQLDKGIWLATTCDVDSRCWVNVEDEPVLTPGPDQYDSDMIALNQVFNYRGVYYAVYHGSGKATPRTWNTNIARSRDLVHWEKYPSNPMVENNKSSGLIVPTSRGLRLYTMHDQVDAYENRSEAGRN